MSDVSASASNTADLLYDATHSAAVGASIVAIFFLVADSLAGDPLFTPSLMGVVLFEGMPAEVVSSVRLDMMALYTLVHFAVFLALGGAISLAVSRLPGLATRPPAVGAILFVVLTGGILAANLTVVPGAVGVIGLPEILAANALTSAGMALFLRRAQATRGAAQRRRAAAPEAREGAGVGSA